MRMRPLNTGLLGDVAMVMLKSLGFEAEARASLRPLCSSAVRS